MGKIIQFPATVARPASTRKRGARSLVEMKAPIDSNQVELIETVRLHMASMWRRRVPIAWIAKMYDLTVAEAEAVVWREYHPEQPEESVALDRRRFGVVDGGRRAA